MQITFQPIIAELFEIQTENTGGQIRSSGFRLEQDKASIAHDPMPAVMTLGVRPTNPAIARVEVKSATRPAEQSDPFSILLGDVAQRLAHHPMFFEIMMFANKFIPARFLFGSNKLNYYFGLFDFLECGGYRMLL
jgi:hypothetical protein